MWNCVADSMNYSRRNWKRRHEADTRRRHGNRSARRLGRHQRAHGREYRRRLLLAFAAENIEIPATRVVQVGDAGKPFPLLMMQGAPPVPR